MTIQDVLVVPSKGIIVIVSWRDRDLPRVQAGGQLQQGMTTWGILGVQSNLRASDQVSILVQSGPVPVRGQATVIDPL